MSTPDEKRTCVNCAYSTRMSTARLGERETTALACEYILMEGKPRPCPAPKTKTKRACRCWAPRDLKRSFIARTTFKSREMRDNPIERWREGDEEWQKMLKELAAGADS